MTVDLSHESQIVQQLEFCLIWELAGGTHAIVRMTLLELVKNVVSGKSRFEERWKEQVSRTHRLLCQVMIEFRVYCSHCSNVYGSRLSSPLRELV